MRIWIVGVLWLGAGCGGGTTSADLGSTRAAGVDLGVAASDDGAALTGCAGFLGCDSRCVDQSCADACYALTIPRGRVLFGDLYACWQSECLNGHDGAPPRCAFPFDQAAECKSCYINSSLRGASCAPASDAVCGACASAYEACTAG